MGKRHAYDFDQTVFDQMTAMRVKLGVGTNAQVIVKALALLRIACEEADRENKIRMLTREGESLVVEL